MPQRGMEHKGYTIPARVISTGCGTVVAVLSSWSGGAVIVVGAPAVLGGKHSARS